MADLMLLPASALLSKGPTKRRGHAWFPGTGPAGETCRTCEFYTLIHRANTYRKCGHPGAPKWTSGPGTDIRARDPACARWAAEKPS